MYSKIEKKIIKIIIFKTSLFKISKIGYHHKFLICNVRMYTLQKKNRLESYLIRLKKIVVSM